MRNIGQRVFTFFLVQMNKMKCNTPVKSWRKGKKRAVRACSNGREKILHYGASGYGHNYSKKARKSFRARHKCHTAKDKLTPRYWACKDLWTKGKVFETPLVIGVPGDDHVAADCILVRDQLRIRNRILSGSRVEEHVVCTLDDSTQSLLSTVAPTSFNKRACIVACGFNRASLSIRNVKRHHHLEPRRGIFKIDARKKKDGRQSNVLQNK